MYFQQRPQNVVNDGFALIEYTKSSEAWDGDIQIHALYLGIYSGHLGGEGKVSWG